MATSRFAVLLFTPTTRPKSPFPEYGPSATGCDWLVGVLAGALVQEPEIMSTFLTSGVSATTQHKMMAHSMVEINDTSTPRASCCGRPGSAGRAAGRAGHGAPLLVLQPWRQRWRNNTELALRIRGIL